MQAMAGGAETPQPDTLLCGNTTLASADLSTRPTGTDHLLCARSYGGARDAQVHTHTEDVLRTPAEVSTGDVCLRRLEDSANGLKRDAICVCSSVTSRKWRQQQVDSQLRSGCLWVINYGLLALAKVSGIYPTFYRET